MDNNNNNISDEDLLEECLECKKLAWEKFYERFSRPVYWAVNRAYKKNEKNLYAEDINDCMQSVWLSFTENDFYKLRRWRGECTLATWLMICSFKEAAKYFNSIIKEPSLIPIEDDPPLPGMENCCPGKDKPDIDTIIINEELLDIIQSIIEKELSNREKLFAEFYWFKGFNYKEISEIMNVSLDNCHLIKHRIEKKIKGFLEDYLDENVYKD